MTRRTLAALSLLFATLSVLIPRTATAQDTLIIGPKMVSALVEANSSIDTLLGLRHSAADALAGKTPGSSGDFMKLAAQYTKAAADIRAAPLPSTLMPTTNVVSLNELTNCPTRPGAIVKLNSYLGDMRVTLQKGQGSVAQLDDEQKEIAKGDEALTFLTNSFQKLSQIPIFGDQFALHWLDLQGAVSHSLADLRSAVTSQRQAFSANVDLMQKEINNYQSNLSLVNSLPHCSPVAGNWNGAGSSASTRFGGAGQSCTWTVVMDNVHLSVSISPDGKVTRASANGNMHETALSPCAPSSMGNVPHSYSLARGSTNGNSITVDLNAAPGNRPRCSAHFTGAIIANHLVGTLTFHRIDQAPALNWTTQHQIH